jgi:hypothetical protein
MVEHASGLQDGTAIQGGRMKNLPEILMPRS